MLYGCTYYGRHLVNTIERSVLGGDAGCRHRYFINLSVAELQTCHPAQPRLRPGTSILGGIGRAISHIFKSGSVDRDLN